MIYGEAERTAALALPETELRMRLDVLLEQCGRETAMSPLARSGLPGTGEPFLYVSEILALMGLGPSLRYIALEELLKAGVPEKPVICVDPRCPAGHAHYGACPGPHRVDPPPPDRVCNDLRCLFGEGHTGPCPTGEK